MTFDWTQTWPVYVFLGFMGLILGSFLNVVIYRLPRGKSIVKPRSACPTCGKAIPFYLNIPVFSYLFLRGKCKHCAAKISPRYLFVELISGLIVLGFYFWLGASWQFLGYTVLTLSLLAIFMIDLEHYIIPDEITYPGMVLGLAFSLVNPEITILESITGMLLGGGGLFLIALIGDWIFKKESMGGGDIKLAAMLGAFLGWQQVLFVFIAASVIGLIASVIAMHFSENVRENHRIPFGPFLAAAAVTAIIFGDYIINLYITRFYNI
ncbi:MAG: prepilin peptidase [candidate division Zixibacteria bacterium]|nr:prepilin peptidase [candidate division Zixibacteria bacterium]NIR64841.1 prepilin peptidase [candidate division Zixibacteria bacterium]NIS17581.1 prepilin peptidase [candidate division Zixibacteria bacterium]NIS46660.1 prepilin peptidase [candidate division Zixibacteria bacterium]NIT53879.1 prepilin peptidase [candidate division Zixibacteria bacterium]